MKSFLRSLKRKSTLQGTIYRRKRGVEFLAKSKSRFKEFYMSKPEKRRRRRRGRGPRVRSL